MRLFIAINFNSETRTQLIKLRDGLRSESTKGRFSAGENLHLTLVFLGECDEHQLAAAKIAMDKIEFEPFDINISRIGRFKRRGSDLWWAGISDNAQLTEIYNRLSDNLTELGFQIEKRKFSPHITLGREIITQESPRIIEKFGQTINKIELMKSEHIAGKLTYTAIHEIRAKKC